MAQRAHVDLGVALVAALEVLCEGDVLDLPALVVGVHGLGHVVEALGAAGAAVEDAADLGVIQQPEVHGHHIVDVDKIALLAVGAVAIAAFEQAHSIARIELLLHVKRHAGHAALVLLAGAIDVEVTQADHRALQAQELGPQVLVKQEFGKGVGIEGVLVASVFLEHRAAALNRGGLVVGHALRARPA